MASIATTWCSHLHAWKYEEWYSVVCCVGFAPNVTLCIQDMQFISLPHFLQFYFIANRMHVLKWFYSVQASFLIQLPDRKETAQGFHHEANGDFKTVTEFNGCDGRKLRMDQNHCSYSNNIVVPPKILTYITEWTEGSLYKIKYIPKHASCLN